MQVNKEGLLAAKQNRTDEKILEDTRVIDLTRMISGPYATRIFADFGAEVIKIQPGQAAHGGEQNDTTFFSIWNRNKRSITLDLELPAARDAFLKLVEGSDVVVENFSPRVMANWELQYERLRDVNPDLVMVSISAMGQTGPWKDFVGFAPTFHALSGLISTSSGELNHPADISYPYADVVAGLYAALAALSALEYRDRTGKGQHIDISAYEALCTLLGHAFFETSFSRSRRLGAEPWGCYPCAGANRWCVIAIRSEEDWQRLGEIANRTELKRARFSAWNGSEPDRTAIDKQIVQWTTGLAAETVASRLQRAGIAAGVEVTRVTLEKALGSFKAGAVYCPLFSAFGRLVHGFMWLVVTLNLFTVLRLLGDAEYTRMLGQEQLRALVVLRLSGSDQYYVGLLFWALAATAVAYLWFKSKYIPGALAVFGVVSSVWCVVCTVVFYISPGFAKVVNLWWFDSPMVIFEITTSFWLLLKGLRQSGVAESERAETGE